VFLVANFLSTSFLMHPFIASAKNLYYDFIMGETKKKAPYIPRFWVLNGLPGQPDTAEKDYTFDIGPLDFAVDQDAFYLHIPEIAHRDAEGRSLYPEQEEWINHLITERRLGAKQIWFSQWQFAGLEHAVTFEKILWGFGASRLWHLVLISRDPGVLLETYYFKITPSPDGCLLMQAETTPPGAEYRSRQNALVEKISRESHANARIMDAATWKFLTPEDARTFEIGLKQRGALHRGESYFY
jgi:hypothetical protein